MARYRMEQKGQAAKQGANNQKQKKVGNKQEEKLKIVKL